jgi:HEPN domain-containing protein
MKNETRIWLKYAAENLESAKILLQSNLHNPCLQNVQQAVEKALKAILVETASRIRKTHDILEIKKLLLEKGVEIDLSDDECDFLNSIYIPSKYPLGSILADYEPDEKICRTGIEIAEKAICYADWIISTR